MYLNKMRGTSAILSKNLYKYLVGDVIFNDNINRFWRVSDLIFSPEAQTLLGPEKVRYL